MAGLASLVSYPALLAYGLPPLAANVTNTAAMFATTAGAAAGSRPELRGQGRRLVTLTAQTALGGAVGAALLLTTSADTFAAVVPWLVALGAVLLLARDRLRTWTTQVRDRRLVSGRVGGGTHTRWLWPAIGMANVVASVAYLVLAPVDLGAAAVLGAGALLGSWLGPQLVRVVSERPLRIAIGIAGLGLAGFLLTQ